MIKRLANYMLHKSHLTWVLYFSINCVEIYALFSALFAKMTGVVEKCPVAENLHKDDVGNFLFTSESVGQGHPGKSYTY